MLIETLGGNASEQRKRRGYISTFMLTKDKAKREASEQREDAAIEKEYQHSR